MVTVDRNSKIEPDDVAFLQLARARNAVDDFVVHRDTQDRRVLRQAVRVVDLTIEDGTQVHLDAVPGASAAYDAQLTLDIFDGLQQFFDAGWDEATPVLLSGDKVYTFSSPPHEPLTPGLTYDSSSHQFVV